MRIDEEIKQSAFRTPYEQAVVNLIYTSNWMNRTLHKFFAGYGLSNQQFNVLRILRGIYPSAASIGLLNDRMLDKMSNVSRLVDKLVLKGLVERNRSAHDLRQVDVIITQEGLDKVNAISLELDQVLEKMCVLSDEESELLSNLLDKLRTAGI